MKESSINERATRPRTVKTAARPKSTGKAPAWALKLGATLASLAIFAGSYMYANANTSVATAPLQPAVAAAPTASAAPAGATGTSSSVTLRLTSSVRTTNRAAITKTASS